MSHPTARRHGRRPAYRRPDAGFSMVELMVVLLIAAILLGVGIPTYLGAQHHSEEVAAQSALTTALTTAQSYYDSHETYSGLTDTEMAVLQPTLSYHDPSGSNGAAHRVQVAAVPGPGNGEPGAPQSESFAAYATDGTCWYVVDVEATGSLWITDNTAGISSPGTYYGAGYPASGQSSCSPLAPGAAPSSGWQARSSSTSQSGWADVSP